MTDKCEFCEELQRQSATSGQPSSQTPSLTKAGKVILGITGASAVAFFAVSTPFLLPALRKVCLPYVPATHQQVKNIFTALKGQTGKLIDLGSGDGRLVRSLPLYPNP